jgi:Sortase domain
MYPQRSPFDKGDEQDVTKNGSLQPKRGRRRLRTATDITAAVMIAAGAVLAGISVSQHQDRDHALALQAAHKAQVERAAIAEAQQFRALAATKAAQAGARSNADGESRVEVPRLPTAGLVLAADHQEAAKTAGPTAGAPSAPTRPRPPIVTSAGTVSEVRGTGATLVIPALKVHAPVVATGAVNGFMTIPADIHTVGWFDGTDVSSGTTTSAHMPWPGQPGVSLLAGHVDWAGEGPGALYYIGQLVPGDPIEVIGSNQKTTYWRVSQPPIVVSKADLPSNLFDESGPPKLALVTCGGPFDAATGHYLDNVIVWAKLATA